MIKAEVIDRRFSLNIINRIIITTLTNTDSAPEIKKKINVIIVPYFHKISL